MKIIYSKEGIIKTHIHPQPPKHEEHMSLNDYQEHLKYKPKETKKIKSKQKIKQKKYEHSIGKHSKILKKVGKHLHHK